MLTSDAFLDALRRLKLVDTEQLSILESDQSSISSRELARDLIAKDLLTPYQVNQLFAGKGEDLLLGSFVLLERLGEGGMGQVFKARNWKLDHIVALKMIREDRLDSPDTIRRFQREIQAVSQLTHPNIVHALDAEESNGRWFLAMEFVEGMDLKQKVSQSGPLSVPAACDAIWQAALGLQHAHERGLVHRDIKPSNLLITDPQKNYPHGQVKILDLGLARFTSDSEDTTLTVEGAIMGTPDYLAPEQGEESHQVDIRADIYSLGCSLYCLLIGEPPFPGGNFMQKLRKHLTQEPVPVEERRSGVPKELGEVVRKMMRKSPGDRYQTPWEVAQALEQAVIPTATPVASRQKPVSPFAGLDEDTIPKEEPADPRKLVWLVALPLVALLGWGLSFLFRGEPGQTASTKPKPLVPPADRAQEDFDKLRRRAHTVGEDQRRLRLDLLSFRRQHFQRPDLCVTVATWLRSMSTPLDRLKALRALNVTQGGKGIERIEIVRFLGTPTWRAWGGCNSLSASRDGSRVVGGTGQGFQIWDESGNPVFYQAVSNGALDVELSPEGELLAVASGSHHLSLWDLSTPRQICSLPPRPAGILTMKFSSDGKWLATSDLIEKESKASWIRILEVKTGMVIHQWKIPFTAHDLAFLPDGEHLVSAGSDGSARVWSIKAKTEVESLHQKDSVIPLRCVALLPKQQKLIWGGDGGVVTIYDLTNKQKQSIRLSNQVHHLAVSSSEKQVLLSGPEKRAIVKLDQNEPVAGISISRSKAAPLDTVFLDRGASVLSLNREGNGFRWSTSNGEMQPIDGHQARLTSLTVSSGEGMAVTSSAKKAIRWHLLTGRMESSLEAKNISEVRWCPDRYSIALAHEEGVTLWPLPGIMRLARETRKVKAQLPCIAFHPSGERWLRKSEDTTAIEEQVQDPSQVTIRLSTENDPITSVAYSPTGEKIVLGTKNGMVILHHRKTGQSQKLVTQTDAIHRIRFHPGGKFFATASRDRSIWLRDAGNGALIQKLTLHRAEVRGLDFSPDGRLMASASDTGELFLWRQKRGSREWERMAGFRLPGMIADLSFTSNSSYLLTANANGVAYLLRLLNRDR